MIHYSCIGATGYVCGEVLRMMVNHHEGELVNVLDTYGVGDAISTHHPALRGFYDQVIMDLTEENVRETAKKSDVIMIQVPSGDVAKWAEIVLAEDCAIIDIGADIRFRDVDVWEKWYGQKHPDAKMTHDAVYCIPEVMRDLAKGKKLIANPGCYPTASTLGLQPMLKAGHIVDNTIVIDAKSGYTGAGRRPALNKLLTEAENNFCAYALGGGHRHTPEIEQTMQALRQFMFEHVYRDPRAKGEEGKAQDVLLRLFEDYGIEAQFSGTPKLNFYLRRAGKPALRLE